MPKIFICYRRDDTRQATGRLYDGLSQYFGEDSVFKDVYSIEYGADWRDRIGEFVAESDLFLAVIGPSWDLERLANADDMLRHELQLAREHGLPVIPVLVDGAHMPDEEDLPEDLHWLNDLQGAPLRDEDYAHDFEKLLDSACERLGVEKPKRRSGREAQRAGWSWGIGAAALAAAAIGFYLITRDPNPEPPDVLIDQPVTQAARTCALPPSAVLDQAGVPVSFAQAGFTHLLIGALSPAQVTASIPLARRAAAEEKIAAYVRCVAEVRDGLTDEQLEHVDGLMGVLAASTGPDSPTTDVEQWLAANPFPGAVPSNLAEVVVAELDDRAGGTGVAVAPRIVQDLRSQLDAYDLSNVTVAEIPTMTESEVDALADQGLNRVVISGWRDDLDVNVRILLGAETTAPQAAGLSVPLPSTNDWESFGFVMREALPANTSFLSLFLVGLLKYQANAYAEGHRAFDAAMDRMPDDVILENEGLQRFFEARRLDTGGSGDFASILCGYAAALEADPTIYGAKLNIATVLAEAAIPGVTFNPKLGVPSEGIECLTAAGILDQSTVTDTDREQGWVSPETVLRLIAEIEEEFGPMALLDYNRLAVFWNTDAPLGAYDYGNREVIRQELEEITATDPSIPGAHLVLGILLADQDLPEQAAEQFEDYLTLRPNDPDVLFNLGQTRLMAGDIDRATELFDEVLSARPTDREGRLAMAGLAVRRGNLDGAADLVPDSLESGLGELISIRQGGVPESGPTYYMSRFRAYLRALALERAGRIDEAEEYWTHLVDGPGRGPGAIDLNDSLRRAWINLMNRCGSDSPPHEWGSTNPCMPADVSARLQAAQDELLRAMSHRLYGRDVLVVYGAACPYVFTFDETEGRWVMDTTVLYELDGKEKETTQRRNLERFDGRILIREVEPEVSHIDQLLIEVVDQDGTVSVLAPDHPSLDDVDGDYLVLERGDEILVTFPAYDADVPILEVRAVATGYYEPEYPSPGAEGGVATR